jgi:Ca-activated chloride channel family protein
VSLELNATFDRSLVPASGAVERFLMLSLRAPEGATRRIPLNLALVVDASGSMTGEKLSRAKEAAGFVVRQLSSEDRVAIVAFNNTVTLVAPSTPSSPTAKTGLLYHISRIETSGSTNLAGGWLQGCAEVAQHQQAENQQSRAIVLTDGLANVGITDPDELIKHARELHARGIATSTLGLGADFNEELLAAMAGSGGGRFQYVETAKHVPDCVQGELGEMLAVSAQNVAVEVALPAGVRCEECLNAFPIETTATGVRLRLGDLIAGDTRRVVLRLAVELPTADQPLEVQALTMYVDVNAGKGTEQSFPVARLSPASTSDIEAEAPDAGVANEVGLLLAAKAKDEAARLGREGDFVAAVGALRSTRASLMASPMGQSMAFKGEIELFERFEQGLADAPNRSTLKEMHYQSYLGRERRKRYDPPSEKK